MIAILADAAAEQAGVRWPEVALRLALALAFGLVIGFDRELRGKPAGLRTMMLVALGSATFVLAGLVDRGDGSPPFPVADLSRVIQGVVGGIGFLGAGVVMHRGLRVEGITTAASIWVTAAVGVAVGLGEYTLSVTAVVMAAATLTVVGRIEIALFGRNQSQVDRDKDGAANDTAGAK